MTDELAAIQERFNEIYDRWGTSYKDAREVGTEWQTRQDDLDWLLVRIDEQAREIERLKEQLHLANIDAVNEAAENAVLREALERLKLECDASVCDCGEPFSETDMADIVNEALAAALGGEG
jgi:septation ring formation regulator EzrA